MTNQANKSEKNLAIAMSNDILDNSKGMNNTFKTSGIVPPVFHTHYVNMESGEYGIADLITKILTDNGSIFPKDCATTDLRNIAIAGAMFTDEILAKVESHFTAGSIRYPLATVKTYLSVFMARKSQVCKIQLTGKEDSNRPCCRPRCKWFLAME